MIEKLVSQYYTDEWESLYMQQGNKIVFDYLLKAKPCMAPSFEKRLFDGWFHDTYLMKLSCNDCHSLCLCLQRHDETVYIDLDSVLSFECVGPLMDRDLSFPGPDRGDPMAQILDVWIEAAAEITLFILLENERYIKIKCAADQQLACTEA